MPIRRLLYTSNSCLKPGAMTLERQVDELAREAAARNAQAGVTGLLVFVEHQFIQILEGESDAIEEVFERICCDFRHTNVKLVDLVAAKERLFGRWHMAQLAEGDDPDSVLGEELREIHYLLGVNARVAVEKMHDCLLGRAELPFSTADCSVQTPA